MSLLLFHQFFLGKDDPGGSRWNQLTRYLSESGVERIDVVAGNIHYTKGTKIGKNTWLNKECLSDKINVYRTWTYSGYNKNFFGRILGYFSYVASGFLCALFLKKPKLIIATSPSLFIGMAALMLSKLKRVPFIFEVRDLWPESAVATGVVTNKRLINIMYAMEKMFYKHADKIVVLTPAFKKDISARFPDFDSKIEIITNAADLDFVDNIDGSGIRENLGWGGKKVFAYFGAHGLANDLGIMLDAAEKLEYRKDILLVMIGDGMLKKKLVEEAAERKISNLSFIDAVSKDKVYSYIAAADVCVAVLKKTDTFKTVYPNKVFDYMACSRPVIVTIDGITRELVEDAGCGFFSEPENADSFASVIAEMADMPGDELDKMGSQGYDYVRKNFDRKVTSEKYAGLIKQVTGN
ncbi:MAG: glycosyltransferase family 4 protein [Deferribacterales bacterium]